MVHRGGSWNRHHHRGMVQQPCERELRDCGPMFFSGGVEFSARPRQLACRYGKPRNECKLVLRAVFDDVLMLSIAEVVLVLHAYDLDYLAGLIDLVRFHFAETNVPDLALFLQFFDCTERLLDWHFGVDAVQLP